MGGGALSLTVQPESPRLAVKLGSSLLTVRLASSLSTTIEVNGVPSTGQKLNLSANSSLHLEQNFIDTTSRLWGSSTD